LKILARLWWSTEIIVGQYRRFAKKIEKGNDVNVEFTLFEQRE
jgi:hypothetical protein